MACREEACCANQSVQSIASHDIMDDSLYGTGEGMPEYMRKAFFTRVLLPQQAAVDHLLDDQEQISVKSIVANFHDYYYSRMNSSSVCSSGYNNSEILNVSDDYKRSGYLTFWRASIIIDNYGRHSPIFTSSMILSLLSTVPDSCVRNGHEPHKLSILRLVLSKYCQECKIYPPESTFPTIWAMSKPDEYNGWPYKKIALTDFTNRRVGRLWLLLDVESFYGPLLNDIVSLPHLTLWESADSREKDVPRYLRDHTTRSMLLVLLARISNDMYKRSFYENVIECDIIDTMFQFTIGHGYIVLALMFSLFVDRARVRNYCSIVNRCRDDVNRNNSTVRAALFYMLQLRGLPFQPVLSELEKTHIKRRLLTPIFDQSLSTRALGCILKHDGLSAILHLHQNVDFPSSITNAIHRYFYTAVWDFVTVYVDRFQYIRGQLKVP